MVKFILLTALAIPAFAYAQQEVRDNTSLSEDLDVVAPSVERFGSRSAGHNLSTNNRTLDKKEWSLGTLYVGYGVTDNLTVAISPFVLSEYDMFNMMVRYAWTIAPRQRLGIDVAYFKTYGGREISSTYCGEYFEPGVEEIQQSCFKGASRYTGFLMEAVNTKLTFTQLVSESYRFNTTLSYFYYFDDRMPFSFRMDPANNDPFTINLTSLNELKLHDKVYLNLEGGFWGLNYEYLYYHAGFSINIQGKNSLFGVGASTTFSPTFPKERAKQFVRYDSRYSIHPELQLQLFF